MPCTTTKRNFSVSENAADVGAVPPNSRRRVELLVDPTLCNASFQQGPRLVSTDSVAAQTTAKKGFDHDDDDEESTSSDDATSDMQSRVVVKQKDPPMNDTSMKHEPTTIQSEDTTTNNKNNTSGTALSEKELMAHEMLKQRTKATDMRAQRELDDFFDEHTREKFSNLPPYVQPDGFKESVELYDYQKDGVRWLVHQESEPLFIYAMICDLLFSR
jgi:hypothetical protein